MSKTYRRSSSFDSLARRRQRGMRIKRRDRQITVTSENYDTTDYGSYDFPDVNVIRSVRSPGFEIVTGDDL